MMDSHLHTACSFDCVPGCSDGLGEWAMALGLSGGSNAGEKRKALLKKLNLPEHMSANAMLQALNLLYTREELEQMLNESGIERD